MFLALGTLVPSCLFSSGDVWSSVWKRSKWVLVTHVRDTAPPLLPRSWWPSGLAISETVQITSHRKSSACRRCHYMPDPNFTIHSGKVLNMTGSKNHIIPSVGRYAIIFKSFLRKVQLALEDMNTWLCASMASLCSIHDWHKFWCVSFFVIVVFLSPLSWSIELFIILLFLSWGEYILSVFQHFWPVNVFDSGGRRIMSVL